jgi:signal transduction histidine kinase
VDVEPRSPWYGSFYWRIGISLVAFVLVVLVAQSVMFSVIMSRDGVRNPDRSPNNLATSLAAELGSALETNPDLDLGAYLTERFGREPWRIFVVMSTGRVAGNSSEPLADEIRRSAESVLARTDPRGDALPKLSGPVVTSPIQIGRELRGLVVLPPPPPGGVLRDVGRLLSLPGTIVLILATIAAAFLIFGPARRRLSALEDAAVRLGQGDLTARAPQTGTDEIARVAGAFNRMADELAARDEALRASDTVRRQMLADVSHELKTPLTVMRGFIETLRMPEVVLDHDRRGRYLETIDRETRRLERIVKDLLDLARYENEALALEIRVFDIERVFQHVLSRREHDAHGRGVLLSVEIAPDADQVVADPDRIEQVIDNLVANALRHSPRGGTIALRATAAPGTRTIEVIDSGEGIPAETLPFVFDRFYKADKSRAAGTEGSGLGLSIVKAIVERHGGTIGVTSRPGCTQFTVVLPQPAARTPAVAQGSRASDRPPATHSPSTNL